MQVNQNNNPVDFLSFLFSNFSKIAVLKSSRSLDYKDAIKTVTLKGPDNWINLLCALQVFIKSQKVIWSRKVFGQ